MNVLVACEESQTVCKAFRERGHEAYSADIKEPSGGHHEWHILGDVLPLIDGDCSFVTMDGRKHRIDCEWDMIIAFPPCTDLASSGARHFARKRADGTQERSKQFFCALQTRNANASRYRTQSALCQPAIENQIRLFSHGSLVRTIKKLLACGLSETCRNLFRPLLKSRIFNIIHGLTRTESKSVRRNGITTPGCRVNSAERLHQKRRRALQTLWLNSGEAMRHDRRYWSDSQVYQHETA